MPFVALFRGADFACVTRHGQRRIAIANRKVDAVNATFVR